MNKIIRANIDWRTIGLKGLMWFGVPLLIYATLFFIFQPHYLLNFSNGFFLDNGDGFQNVWNIWWVNESAGQSGSNPYFTTMLHWPHGTSLLPQTMNIYNGLVAIPLMNFFGFSLIQAVNVAVLSAFLLAGVFMFWFIYKLHKNYWVSIIAGALFTFSTYHFAHGIGHLQLVSLQFIPLFLLAFWTLIEKMRYRYAPLAAGALFLVMLTDYYYLFWCIILGAMYVGWQLLRKELKITRQNIKVTGLFVITSALLILPLIIPLLLLNKHDPLTGSHDATQFALDPLSIFVPGGSWYWNSLTDWHWTHLEYMAETSVFLGFGLLGVGLYAFYMTFFQNKQFKAPSWLNFWWIVILIFGIMSLGPRPTLFGKTAHFFPLPYAVVEKIFPTLKLSGMPVRWILIVLIAGIVIVSYVLSRLNLKTVRGVVLLFIFVVVSMIDLRPIKLPLTNPQEYSQDYVYVLKDLPYGAVLDDGARSGAEQLFHQTIHEKPMVFGYVTRTPQSVETKSFLIYADIAEGRPERLCSIHKLRYYTTPAFRPMKFGNFPVIYNDGNTLIYDLKNSENC
jgi:hypothetical protein